MLKFLGKNVSTLVLGTFIAQFITIIFTPILSRIFSPNHFGLFAIIFSLTGIFSTIIGGRYEIAIVQAKNNSESINLSFISSLLMIIFTSISVVICFLFKDFFVEISNLPFKLILLAPIVSLFIGLFNILNMLNTKFENYNTIALSKIIRSSLQGIFPIILSLTFISSLNLIFGFISGFVGAYIVLFKKQFIQMFHKDYISFKTITSLLKKYKEFPLYNAPSSLVDNFTLQFPLIFIYFIAGETMNGYYFLAARMISIPTSLIGLSYAQVFYRDIVSIVDNNSKLLPFLINTLKKLMIISIPIFILIFFASPKIFPLVFGIEWKQSGIIAQYLGCIFLIQFNVSTVSQILLLKENLYKGAVWKYIYFISSAFLYTTTYYFQIEFYTFLTILVIHEYILYAIYFYLIYSSAFENDKRLIIK